MSKKRSSAARRVLKSVVGPALQTSLAALLAAGVGCSTRPASEKPRSDSPEKVSNPLPPVGMVPFTQPATAPTSQNNPATQPDKIPDPGTIREVPKPGIRKVGKMAPNPGKMPHKVGMTRESLPKVGTELKREPLPRVGVKAGIHIDPELSPESRNLEEEAPERPTRLTRRATDPDGSALRTGLLGGGRRILT